MKNKFVWRIVLTHAASAWLFFYPSLCAQAAEANREIIDQAFAQAEAKTAALEPKYSPAEEEKIEQATVFRQDVQEVVAIKEEKRPFETESFLRFMPKVKAYDQDGSVGIADSSVQWSYAYKLFNRVPLEFSMEQDYIGVNNSTQVKLPSRLTGIGFGVDVTLPLLMLKNMYFRIGVTPSFYTDNWSLYENALRLPQRYFAIWQPNDKFTAILGLAVTPRFKDVFLPIAGIIYKPNDKWLFNLVPDRPTISYAVNDKLSIYGEYSMSGGEYVVTKDDIKGTVLEYDEQHAGVGLQYDLNKYVCGSLAVGGTFGRKFNYRESYGKVNLKNGFYTEVRVNVSM